MGTWKTKESPRDRPGGNAKWSPLFDQLKVVGNFKRLHDLNPYSFSLPPEAFLPVDWFEG